MRRWAVLAILTYRKYVPVAALRPPSLRLARYACSITNVVAISERFREFQNKSFGDLLKESV